MQLITCPWCGPREENEFRYGGQAGLEYPADPAALDDEQWARFVFFRDNPEGAFAERWCHDAGCRRWLRAVRDTRTYVFAETRPYVSFPRRSARPERSTA